MSFYTNCYENDDETWTAQLMYVYPPFIEDEEGEMTYNEAPVLVAFGETREAALLQIRAELNSALGGVELDIMRGRGHVPHITTEDIEDVTEVDVEEYAGYDAGEDDEDGD